MSASRTETEHDLQYVRDLVRRSGSSFLWGMRVLPRPRRDAMYAIYAYCREIDDIADEPGAEADKLAALATWGGVSVVVYFGLLWLFGFDPEEKSVLRSQFRRLVLAPAQIDDWEEVD